MHLQVCPRFNLLFICDFMAQLQDIAFDKTSVLILRVVYLRNSGCVQKITFGWTNTTVDDETGRIAFSNEP